MTPAEREEIRGMLSHLTPEQVQQVRVKIAELLASQQNPKPPTQ